MSTKYNIKNGSKFGKLTVVCTVDDKYCVTKCDCGSKPKVIGIYSLVYGNTRSCGCLIGHNMGEAGKEKCRQMGLSHRKHFGCTECGSDKHYAKGLCRSCYNKQRRGTL